MGHLKSNLIILLVSIFVCTAVANASLYNDPAAISGYTGISTFAITQSGSTLIVNVEYAVYSPGSYSGLDLSGGSEYIYAYQIFNSSHGNVAVDFFSVGITCGSCIENIYTDSSYGSLGGVIPVAFEMPQSASYIFMAASLDPGEHSSVLLFSSIHSPMMGFGSISGGGLAETQALAAPSILPEPATIVMFVPALLVLINKRKNSKA